MARNFQFTMPSGRELRITLSEGATAEDCDAGIRVLVLYKRMLETRPMGAGDDGEVSK